MSVKSGNTLITKRWKYCAPSTTFLYTDDWASSRHVWTSTLKLASNYQCASNECELMLHLFCVPTLFCSSAVNESIQSASVSTFLTFSFLFLVSLSLQPLIFRVEWDTSHNGGQPKASRPIGISSDKVLSLVFETLISKSPWKTPPYSLPPLSFSSLPQIDQLL